MNVICRFVLAVSLVALALGLSSCVYPAYDGYYTEASYYRPRVMPESDYYSRPPYISSAYPVRRYYRVYDGRYYRPYGPGYGYYRY